MINFISVFPHMKKVLVLFSILLITCQSYCQSWQWAKHIGSFSSYGERAKVISDGSNVYVIGSYGGIMYLPNDTLYSNGINDIFIIKYDAQGNEIWAKTIGGLNTNFQDYENATGVFDPVNNCLYIGGNFIGTAIFGSTTFTSSNDSSDLFVSRMDLNGNFIWTKKAGSNKIDRAYIFVQPDGNVLLAGKVSDTAYFDSYQVNAGGFLARYDSNGNCTWAEHKFTGPENFEINIAFIGNDIIMSGLFNTNGIIDTVSLNSNGSIDGYLTKMDSAGKIKWIKTFGGTGVDGVTGVAIDNINNIYVSGAFETSINIDGVLLNNLGKDIFIAKFNSNGVVSWAKQANANGGVESAADIKVDIDGNCYLTGIFSGSATFSSFNISTLNSNDMFICRFNNNGDCFGVRHFGQASGHYVTVDNSNMAYCIGTFQNTIVVGNTSLTSYDNQDIYLAKIDEITGIGGNQRVDQNQLIIYANPNKGTFNIKVPDAIKSFKQAWLYVYDASGNEIARFNLDNESDTPHFEISNSKPGSYSVRLVQGEMVYSGQMIVE